MATPDLGQLVYSTIDLIQLVPNLKTAESFLLDRFFPNIYMSDTEYVAIDIDVGKRRMSPFVSPLVEGKLVEQRRYQTNAFKPAYIKDKRAPDLRRPVMRMKGERIGGTATGEERQMMNLAAEVTDQIDILTRRLEWMAAQALLTGTVLISGEGFETSLVDFGRDPSMTIALTGSSQWTRANIGTEAAPGTVSPTSMLQGWQRNILKMTGARVTDIVFTTSAWEAFLMDPVLKGAIVFPNQNPSGNIINPGALIEKGAVYMGRWGMYDLWVYNEWYVDDDNIERPMLPDGTLIMSGPALLGTRAFGMIMDPSFNYSGMAYAPKTWIEPDPAQQFLMMQSSPIVIPSRVNACLAATVTPGVYT